jgi:hypothetical protein
MGHNIHLLQNTRKFVKNLKLSSGILNKTPFPEDSSAGFHLHMQPPNGTAANYRELLWYSEISV